MKTIEVTTGRDEMGVAKTEAREGRLLGSFQHAAASVLDLLGAVRNPLAYALLGTTSGLEARQLADVYRTRDVTLWIEAARYVQARELVRN